MNSKICLLQFFISLVFNTNILSQVPTEGLVAYYPFNGNANDESGQGNDGIVNEASLTEDRNGNANSAYHFNGSNSYIKVVDAENLRMKDSVTVSFWFKTDGTEDFSGLVMKVPDDNPRTGYLVCLNGDKKGTFMIIYDHADTAKYKTVRSENSLDDGKWHHLVGIYDSKTVKLYIDCVLQEEQQYTLGMQENSEPLYIGYDPYAYNPRYFEGEIDDIAIYNRALEINEIMDICEDTSVSIDGDKEVCQGEQGVTYSVSEIEDAVSYNWTYSGSGMTILENGNSINVNFSEDATSGYLSVSGYNSCGEGESSSIYITVTDCDNNSYEDRKIPNSFSTNGDNVNDLFIIGGLIEHTSLTIFNRFGGKLYQTANYQNDWDGTDKDGNLLSTDTYWYVIEIPGISTPVKGFVYLKR